MLKNHDVKLYDVVVPVSFGIVVGVGRPSRDLVVRAVGVSDDFVQTLLKPTHLRNVLAAVGVRSRVQKYHYRAACPRVLVNNAAAAVYKAHFLPRVLDGFGQRAYIRLLCQRAVKFAVKIAFYL